MAALITPIGVISFPVLFTPRAVVAGGDLRYGLSLILDAKAQKSPQFAALRQLVAQTIDAKWGTGKSRDKAFVARLRNPFLSTEGQDYEGYEDKDAIFIRPWSKNKPGVVDAHRDEITVPGDVWPGQMGRCSVNAFAYEQSGNRGVSFGLNSVQICRTDGKRLDGRKPARDEYDDYDDGSVSAKQLVDDDIPF
jgi:hypothetical protein